MAVVVTYRGSGIINLATGAISMVAAYSFWALKSGYFHVTFGTVPAAVVTMLVAILVGVLSELLVFRPLRTSSPLAKLVASLGILLILQATMLLWFGSPSQSIPSVFPKDFVKIFGTSFPVSRFWMAGVVVLIAVALGALFRWTRFGLATRAASENEVFGMLAGLSPNQLSMANTVLASALAGAMGIVAAPLAQANSIDARAVHRAGAGRRLVRRVRLALDRLPCRLRRRDRPVARCSTRRRSRGSRPTRATRCRACRRCSTFLLLVFALSLRGASLPSRGELVEKRLPSAPRPRHVARPAAGLAVAGVVLLIVLPFGYRQALMLSLIGIVVCLSLVVITGFVGQVSLAQVTLAGVSGLRRVAHDRRCRYRLSVGAARPVPSPASWSV